MRIPNNKENKRILELNSIYDSVSKKYQSILNKLKCYEEIDIMLPDLTISKHTTFREDKFRQFLERVIRNLNWSTEGVSITTTDDLKRMHIKLDARINRHKISCYLSAQYHTLLFYRCDANVIKLKEELDKTVLEISAIEEKVKEEENEIIEKEIRSLGYDKLDDHELLMLLYNNEEITSKLESKINAIKRKYQYDVLIKKREKLLTRLQNYVIEVYTLEDRLIDYMQLMQGEEGLCIYFDLSIKDIDRIRDIQPIVDKMYEVGNAIDKAIRTN